MECVVLPFGGSWGRGERIMCLGFAWFRMEILWFRVDFLEFNGSHVLFFRVCMSLRERFMVLCSRYRIFSVFRERNLRVRVNMRLVDFLRVLMFFS